MQAITRSTTPPEGGEVFEYAKAQSFLLPRSSTTRPLSQATEIFDTEFEDSEFEEEYSPKGSFETDDRRRSQTTISSYDEAPTPSSTRSQQQPFEIRFRPVEGPKGPHLFRSSQVSADFAFDYALQMSPLLPKKPPPRTESAISEDTVTPVTRQREEDFSIETALAQPGLDGLDPLGAVRTWSPQQVVDWAYASGIDESIIECFVVHDVDGKVLLDLQFDQLKELDIQSFGKRHQLWNSICDLKGEERRPSPRPTPFEDISRPCTASARRESPSQSRDTCRTPIDGGATPIDGATGKKRRGRKVPKHLDVITPAESISIVAIEQLLPKPHKCAKGERCAKWRKQQRELQQLHQENGIGRFPISPTKGGRIFVHGDPGNATTAENMIPNVRMQPGTHQEAVPESPFGIPSVVASSDLLGPGQLPEFALHADVLQQLEKRDPQDNVKQFLNFQHMHSPGLPVDDQLPPGSPAAEPRQRPDAIQRSATVPPVLFPEQHFQAYPSLQPHAPAPRQELRRLPKLGIPRAATAGPNPNTATATAMPQSAISAVSICRSATASPGMQQQIVRLASPASEMDVPTTAFPMGPIERETSASVPPNMHFRPGLGRSHSRAADWHRPLPAVKENEILSPISDAQTTRPSYSTRSSSDSDPWSHSIPERKVRDPAHHSPETKHFGYGGDCTHAGWMKKRRARMLRHEWHDAHFRLKGTELGMYENARLSTTAKETINVDHYAVACSTLASTNKLAAAMKAFHFGGSNAEGSKKGVDATAFAFQLVPQAREGEARKLSAAVSGKTHHFAVKSKDERIDWMRELMLAKALLAKGKGFEVEVNGVQA
ncbi:hypothetical protein EJ03DRAFT_376122 [Teratosphaeria nubilosa]|uniref:SAM and PH domain-containing protein n=1 Tax=Teratosphaeria nubilosa TaxID=161662 RepID=A0A6G1L4B7_9PEZI|nr:hypothetical protein EJ03DRAFT_376122 [Teratosphaeria nubilosa]